MGNLLKTRLLVAGPTCGKSWLESNYPSIIDTDRVVEKLVPEYFIDKLYNYKDIKVREVLNRATDIIVGQACSDAYGFEPIMSNRWSPRFFAGISGQAIDYSVDAQKFIPPKELKGLHRPVFFFRNNPDRIRALSAERDPNHILDRALCAKWVAGAQEMATAIFGSDHVIWLEDDEFIGDYVKVVGNNFIVRRTKEIGMKGGEQW